MGNWHGRLAGQVELVLRGPDPAWALNRLCAARVPFWDVDWRDSFTVALTVPTRASERARAEAGRAMCDCETGPVRGLPRQLGRLLRRPVLLLFLLLNLAAIVVLPRFVFFYSVTGNETVPEEQILRALEDLGVGFGTYGPDIRPQWIKDHLLNTLTDLQWITVTQNGCLAQVVVRERPETPETEDRRQLSHVVAARDGVIISQSILAGQALCKVGDTVQAGQRLVSGIVDLDWTYAVENAKAEIYAYTHRTGTVVTPDSGYIKEATGETVRCLWLEVGKRRIKIFGNSGILEASCDKMWERQPLTLPGGYELPVALIWETYTPYTLRAASSTESAAQLLLADYAESMTRADMVAGEILERDLDLTVRRGIYRLDWDFRCREMIARSVEFDFSEKDFDP